MSSTTAMRVQPLLVTGVGRSGSTYLARVFRDVGLNFSHDDRSSYLHVPGADGAGVGQARELAKKFKMQ